ncbi:hypothetical protein ACFCV8_00910 [Streptomyces sp. NPDC056347]|uniref:hypothetical protein n=1 Tax=Streptomyces sp. NPDC056347 TaxID=3345790 RepID=UPI0035E31E18
MSRYLEEAATLLRKAAATNEENNRKYPSHLTEGRERIANHFATLAAIDNGLLPADTIRDVLGAITRQDS